MSRIIVKDVCKKFKIGFAGRLSLWKTFVNYFSGREPKKTIEVLDKISFEVESGEILGIVGANGSGKSTLLRIITGIYKPDSGSVQTNGRVTSLINLGVGLKERLTMKENIFLMGSFFGMGWGQIKENFDSIVQFSGLQQFVNTKIFQFSAGMSQRLVFSIAIHTHPDILILDEVFEVGDEDFRQKSAQKIKELRNKGASVIVVSHDADIIKKYCDRVIFLKGDVQKNGWKN